MAKLPVLLISILFLLLLPLSFAKTNYTEAGYFDNNYRFGTGEFGDVSDENIEAVSLTEAKGVPIVADFDNDGYNEIAIVDHDKLRIFSANYTMPLISELSLDGDERISNIIAYDINDDGLIEIIWAQEESQELVIAQYNEGTAVNKSTLHFGSLAETYAPNIALKCGKANNCLMAYISSWTALDDGSINVISFNETNFSSAPMMLSGNSEAGDENWCLPRIRHIAYKDYDADGTDEYIFTDMHFDKDNNEEIEIWYVRVGDDINHTITVENSYSADSCGSSTLNPWTTDSAANCLTATTSIERYFSSPLVANLIGSSQLETAVALSVDNDEYKLCVYDLTGGVIDEYDDYPEMFLADGTIISNVMLGSVIPDASVTGTDFCVLGYEKSEINQVNVLCANAVDDENYQFKYQVSGYNISENYPAWEIISHLGQESSSLQDKDGVSRNIDELLITYGVFRFDWENSHGAIEKWYDLQNLWGTTANTVSEGVLISVDARKNNAGGLEDLMFMRGTVLYYYDDNIVNLPPNITEIIVKPCLESNWKVNTSVGLLVKVTDPDGDDVMARVRLYYNDDNVQDSGWKGNYTSGTVIPFDPDFIANKTIASGQIYIEANDTVSSGTTSKTIPFTVSNNGVEYGECYTEYIFDTETAAGGGEVEAATLTEDATENSVTTGLTTISGLTGLGGTTLWFLIMVVVTIAIWYYASMGGMAGGFTAAISMLVNIGMLMIGVRIGIVSVAYIVIITVIAAAVVGIFLAKFFTSHTT